MVNSTELEFISQELKQGYPSMKMVYKFNLLVIHLFYFIIQFVLLFIVRVYVLQTKLKQMMAIRMIGVLFH
jgi:hypothetical protein